MSIEIFTPHVGRSRIPPGTISFHKAGQVRIAEEDLNTALITENVAVLINTDLKSLVLRPANKGEPFLRIYRDKQGRNPKISLKGALLKLGVNPSDVIGRRKVVVTLGRITIPFATIELDPIKRPKRKERLIK